MCKARSAHFLKTSAEKRGVQMSALNQGLKVSPTCSVSGSFCIRRKRACCAARTSLAQSTPWTLCDTIHRIQVGPRPLIRNFYPFQGFAQRDNRVFEVLFQMCQSCLASSLILSLRVGSKYYSACILCCLNFPGGFGFLGLLCFLHSHSPAHFFVGLKHLSPVSSFDAFVQRLTEGTPVAIHPRGTPSLFFLCGRH